MMLNRKNPEKCILHEEYFRTISPMYSKIIDDMISVQELHGNEWKNLSYNEQCKILDQTLVDEATVRRYETAYNQKLNWEYFPKLRISTGQKIVSDEKLTARGYSCIWRDEHSAPFSWHTQSQMDLTLDTPLPSPTQSNDASKGFELNSQSKTKSPRSETNLLFSRPVYETVPFLWHYDPHPNTRPSDLVIDSTLTKALSTEPLIYTSNSDSHVVKNDNESSISSLMKGALHLFTGSCIPLQSFNKKKTLLHPGTPFNNCELKPLHVISKVCTPVITQPNVTTNDLTTGIRDLSFSTLCDNLSERSTEPRKTSLQNKYWMTNRKSESGITISLSDHAYGIQDEYANKEIEYNKCSQLKNTTNSQEYPLIMMQHDELESSEPGFDFLYNW